MKEEKNKRPTLSRGFIRWLLLIVAIAFFVSLTVSWTIETIELKGIAADMLRLNIADVRKDITDASDKGLLELTQQLAEELEQDSASVDPRLSALGELYDVAGVSRNRHIGETGRIIIADKNGTIVSDRDDHEGESLAASGISADPADIMEEQVFTAVVYGERCYCMVSSAQGYTIAAAYPEKEVLSQRSLSIALTVASEVAVFILVFILIFLLVRGLIGRSIDRILHSLAKISRGDLEEKVDVRSYQEFSVLSDDINGMVDSLKQYAESEKKRLKAELVLAQDIQRSSLPAVFPPYPDRSEFGLFAAMRTAKEVGGDFYDFYLLEEKKLAFLIADVSGKGIPAALFMMSGKTVLRDFAERGDAAADVVINANRKLCEGNEAEMFITAWMGFLETDTGQVRFINAGHNPPVLIRRGQAGFVPMKANLMMGFLEDVPYKEQYLSLEPGDLLFLYTDGITEAIDPGENMYGNERLLRILSDDFGSGNEACERVCEAVVQDVDAFAKGAEQFDDMTVLCLYYGGDRS